MNNIPTVQQLYTDIIASLEAEFNVTIPTSGKNFLRSLSAVQAAKLWLYYLTIAKVQKNIFVDTADSEASGGTLERFGRVKLGRNPFPATAGQYTVDVTGTIGAIIPAGTTFKSNDDSQNPAMLFILDNAHTLVASTDSITIRALEAGLDSKLSLGDELTATAPIANVDKTATVTAETVEPLAAETLEEYRQLAMDAYRLEPQGGAPSDYRIWAADVQGVAKVYPYAKSGVSNEIDLFVEATVANSTDGKGTPSALMLSDVEAAIEADPATGDGRRPLGVHQVHCQAVTIREIDIEITGFQNLTASIQSALQSAFESELANIRPFIAGADALEDQNDLISVNKLIYILQTSQPGSVFTSLALEVDGNPVSSFQFTLGDIPHLNSITYV